MLTWVSLPPETSGDVAEGTRVVDANDEGLLDVYGRNEFENTRAEGPRASQNGFNHSSKALSS